MFRKLLVALLFCAIAAFVAGAITPAVGADGKEIDSIQRGFSRLGSVVSFACNQTVRLGHYLYEIGAIKWTTGILFDILRALIYLISVIVHGAKVGFDKLGSHLDTPLGGFFPNANATTVVPPVVTINDTIIVVANASTPILAASELKLEARVITAVPNNNNTNINNTAITNDTILFINTCAVIDTMERMGTANVSTLAVGALAEPVCEVEPVTTPVLLSVVVVYNASLFTNPNVPQTLDTAMNVSKTVTPTANAAVAAVKTSSYVDLAAGYFGDALCALGRSMFDAAANAARNVKAITGGEAAPAVFLARMKCPVVNARTVRQLRTMCVVRPPVVIQPNGLNTFADDVATAFNAVTMAYYVVTA